MDYEGVMAVPITFMNQHNPNQYDILGITSSSKELTGGLMTDESLSTRVMIDGKYIYSRVLIQKKK
jgi:hypothetical protein